jgi:hypothetical protein
MDTSNSSPDPGLGLLGGAGFDEDIWAMDIDSPSADDIGAVLKALDCSPRASKGLGGGSALRRSVTASGFRSSRLRFQAADVREDDEVAMEDQSCPEAKVTAEPGIGKLGGGGNGDTWMTEGGFSAAALAADRGGDVKSSDRRLTFGALLI